MEKAFGKPRRGAAEVAVAALMLALWFAISLVSASPTLHHWFHCDSGQLQHQCLATAVSKGGALPVDQPLVYLPPEQFTVAEAAGCTFVISFLSYSEPLTRGPPA